MIRVLLIVAVVVSTAIGMNFWQQQLRADAPMLPVTFAHADHLGQNCLSCHHNYVDDTGNGLCFDCHKTDPEVAALVEAQFHDLCMGCHLDRQRALEDGGPVRACGGCHTVDDEP